MTVDRARSETPVDVNLKYEPVATAPGRAIGRSRDQRGTLRQSLVAARPGSPLALDIVTLDAGTELTLGSDPDRHELVYVLDGQSRRR